MKSISDILSSMVQPAEQNPLFGANSTAASQSANSQTGSFGDVLSRLTSHNNQTAGNDNVATSNSGTPAQNNFSLSNAQVSITDVQVKETVQTNSVDPTALKNIETTVASMAAALSQLVQLASNLQNLNPDQAQNLLVQASGGALSASQAQQLVSQLTAFKDQQTGQSALNLTAGQQGSLVAQLLQTMLQNQQITVTPAASSQSANNNSSNFSALQFNFASSQNGQNSGTTVESLSVNIETLNLQASDLNTSVVSGQTNGAQAVNLTDDTTQRLTQLLQQLNVAPGTSPVNIQVDPSVISTNSSDLAKNFQNLVQILTQANAGKVILSSLLAQGKNDQSGNLQQALNQLTQNQNIAPSQSAAVTGASPTGSSNLVSLSNNAQNSSTETLNFSEQSLTVKTNGQNVQIQDVQLQVTETLAQSSSSNQSTQAAQPASNVQTPQAVTPATPVVNTNVNNVTTQPVINVQASQAPGSIVPAASQAVNNAPSQPSVNVQPAQAVTSVAVQPADNTQTQSNPPAIQVNLPQGPGPVVLPTAPSISANLPQGPGPIVIPTAPIQVNLPQGPGPVVTPVTAQTTNNTPAQSTQVVINVQAPQAPVPTAPVVVQTINDTPSQPAAPVVNIEIPTPVVTQPLPVQTTNVQTNLIPTTSPAQVVSSVPNTTPVSAVVNPQNTDQSQLALTNGQLEALNTIVARFNSGVIQTGPTGPNTNTLKGNTFLNVDVDASTTLNNGTLAQAITPQALAPVEQTTAAVNTSISAQQTTQLTNAVAQSNTQNQPAQSTSQVQQPTLNTLNASNQNAFVQTGVNTTANGSANLTVPVTAPVVSNAPVVAPITAPVVAQAPTQQVSVNDQTTAQAALPTSTSTNTVPVQVQAPVVTQPVVNPASVTAQNVPATTVVGEAVKAAVVAPVPANAPVVNNAPVVANVSATQAVQPVTAQAVTQTPITTESSTGLNVSVNSNKDNLSNTSDLQNILAGVSSTITPVSDKQNNTFQNTVNTVANSNPNGSVDSAQILNQIRQEVAAQADSAKMVSRLNFQLVPESLGRVTVQVALVDQSVSARIVVSNPEVREVLQQHMVDLKAALSQAGLQIDQMQVQVQGGGANLLAQYYQYQQEGNSFRNSAWVPNAPVEEAQNADNSTISSSAYSNALVNILA